MNQQTRTLSKGSVRAAKKFMDFGATNTGCCGCGSNRSEQFIKPGVIPHPPQNKRQILIEKKDRCQYRMNVKVIYIYCSRQHREREEIFAFVKKARTCFRQYDNTIASESGQKNEQCLDIWKEPEGNETDKGNTVNLNLAELKENYGKLCTVYIVRIDADIEIHLDLVLTRRDHRIVTYLSEYDEELGVLGNRKIVQNNVKIPERPYLFAPYHTPRFVRKSSKLYPES